MVQILWLPATSQKLGPSFQFGTLLRNSSACVLSEMCETKFHTHVRQQKKNHLLHVQIGKTSQMLITFWK